MGQVSALQQQKLLRRAEARLRSAATAIKNLEEMGEGLLETINVEDEALVLQLREDYQEALEHLEALALAMGKVHMTAQKLCLDQGVEIIHEPEPKSTDHIHTRGTPKAAAADIGEWIVNSGGAGLFRDQKKEAARQHIHANGTPKRAAADIGEWILNGGGAGLFRDPATIKVRS